MEEVALAEQLECGNELLGARAFGLLPDGNECHPGAAGSLIYSWERGPLARFLM